MSKSLNRVQLIGNIGGDPEVRSTTSGTRVASFSVATSNSWKGKDGSAQEKTEWHRCIAWNRKEGNGLADIVEKYVSKGDRIYVEGEIEYRQWEDKDGQKRYTTEIKVKDLIMLGGNKSEGTAPPKSAPKAAKNEEFTPQSLEETDDDLPF